MDHSVDKTLTGWSHAKVVVNGSVSKSRPVTSGVPLGTGTKTGVVNTLVGNVNGGNEWNHSKFAEDTKLWIVADILDERSVI
ncbi:rna-directed dna polymerase from mobile element jockey-like [Willisornis vidua]|uniref:Rna-directed dna polymerase from mobile element jockey-like n=1 Tax=Willisornis vidua TaxID=1566151 RepID=A0ABQ9DIG3_9PASS|nr:rna-directed dna polymerase from mobile element jockey-like [Willisornis vidua]